MTTRRPVSFLATTVALWAVGFVLVVPSRASAQPTDPGLPGAPLPPPPPPSVWGAVPPAVPPLVAANPAIVAPGGIPAGGAMSATTDHDTITGHWGIQANKVTTVQRTPMGCASGTDCSLELDALSVRHWSTDTYAWNLGVVLGVGGGSERVTTSSATATLDTYFAFGATFGSSFLLANWKHLAISAGPQFDVVFFAPSSSGSKTFLINASGVIEGELHLGFIGVPAASVALSTGMVIHYQAITAGKTPMAGEASEWSIGPLGPTSLEDLTKVTLRYYF